MIVIDGKQYETYRYDCLARSDIHTCINGETLDIITSRIVDIIDNSTLEENSHSSREWLIDRRITVYLNEEHRHYISMLQMYVDPLTSLRI